MIETLVRTVKRGAPQPGTLLHRQPILASMTLALSLGGGLGLFGLVDASLLTSLPFPQPDELVRIEVLDRRDVDEYLLSETEFTQLASQQRGFADLAAVREAITTVALGGRLETVSYARVSPQLFRILGVPAALGRTFGTAPGHEPDRVVVLSHEFWSHRLGGDPQILGTTLDVQGMPVTVIGVMPEGFGYPLGISRIGRRAQFWSPLIVDDEATEPSSVRFGHLAHVVARLEDASRIASAQKAFQQLVDRLATTSTTAHFSRPLAIRLRSLHETVLGPARPWIQALAIGLFVLLCLSCISTAGLLFGRNMARRPDWRVREALGATRADLLVQVGLETCVVTTLGALGALFVAAIVSATIRAMIPSEIVLLRPPAVTTNTLLIACGAVVLTTCLVVFFAPRTFGTAFRKASRARHAAGFNRVPLARTIIAAQLGLSVLLLAGGSLFGLTLWRVMAADLGFSARDVYAVAVNARPGSPARGTDYVARIAEASAAMPDVASVAGAASVCAVPFRGGLCPTTTVSAVSGSGGSNGRGRASVLRVTENYFETLGIAVVNGRLPTRAEYATSVLLNEEAERRYLPGVWRSGVQLDLDGVTRVATGVVGDVRAGGPESNVRPEVYIVVEYDELDRAHLLIRSRPGRSVGGAVQDLVAAVLPTQAVPGVFSLTARFDELVAFRKFAMVVAGALAVCGLVASCVGVVAIVALAVSYRRREVGIRLAIGGPFTRVVRAVVGREAAGALVGIAGGGIAGLWALSSLRAFLFGIEGAETIVILQAMALLGALVLGCAVILVARTARGSASDLFRAD